MLSELTRSEITAFTVETAHLERILFSARVAAEPDTMQASIEDALRRGDGPRLVVLMRSQRAESGRYVAAIESLSHTLALVLEAFAEHLEACGGTREQVGYILSSIPAALTELRGRR